MKKQLFKKLKQMKYLFLLSLSFTTIAPSSYGQTFTVGTGTDLNGTQGYPAPFADYWENSKTQILIKASELTAGGMSAGDAVTEIGWIIESLNGTGLIEDYSISYAWTTDTVLTKFLTGLSVVYDPDDFTPDSTGDVIFPLTTTTTAWNGSDNLVIQILGGDPSADQYSSNCSSPYTVVPSSAVYYTSDSEDAGAATTGSVSGNRPNTIITYGAPSACFPVANVASSNVTTTTADISWSAPAQGPALGYEYVVDTSAATPTVAGTSTTDTFVSLSGLNAETTYYVFVRVKCSPTEYSSWSLAHIFQTLIPGDLPEDAFPIVVDAGPNTLYSNEDASAGATEPYPYCSGNPVSPVWFKFVAPASGAVKVSTDYSGGTLADTKIGVFAAADSSDYSTFELLACDEDNGVTVGYASIVAVTGLTAGTTYYVAVDKFGPSTNAGTFYVTVDELNATMLSTTNTCSSDYQSIYEANTDSSSAYTGWTTIVDADGKLVANAKNIAGGGVSNFSGAQNVNSSGTVRVQQDGISYLDRNWYLVDSSGSNDFLVQLFLLSSETAALGASLGDLKVTKVSGGPCLNDVASDPANDTLIIPVSTGTVNGVDWLTLNVSSFSNFFVSGTPSPLFIDLGNIHAFNQGRENVVVWNTLNEAEGDQFRLERSADGRTFERIASIPAHGAASEYVYHDAKPIIGVNYYRLQIINQDGSTYYSTVVSARVQAGKGFGIVAYPNPASDNVTISISGETGNGATITITDITGKVVSTIRNITGNELQIPMAQLSQGVYLIKYTDSQHSETIKVTKK